VLVSNLYLYIRSLSPQNHPSSLPPDLTALVLTLFEVGGVESMITEKSSLTDFARVVAIGCSCGRDQLHQIL